jgi:hypothetical protein
LDETLVKSERRAAARPRRGPTLLERSRALITGQDLPFAGGEGGWGKGYQNNVQLFSVDRANEKAVTILRQVAEMATVEWPILGVLDVIRLCVIQDSGE